MCRPVRRGLRDTELQLTYFFSDSGPLASAIPSYRLRPQQVEMAQAVEHAIEKRSVLIAEAGTGTGKTFAYLAPALAQGGKVIISTGTKTLQDQLFSRDIPMVRNALQAPVTVALLKGRANYVCHYHLERAKNDGRFLNRDDVVYLARIESYAKTSKTGDRSGLASVPEDATVWPQVTSTRENCLGGDCPNYKQCFVMEARKQAMEADVVVVNHHLFFADVVLRDEGVAELLPACNTVIFDEAHQLPETASLFFGETVSTHQLIELGRDTRMETAASAKDNPALPDAAAQLEKAARDLRLQVREDLGRQTYAQATANRDFTEALNVAVTRLGELAGVLESQADRSEGLRNCWIRAIEMLDCLGRWQQQEDHERVRWVEVFANSVHVNATPLSIADIFHRQISGNPRAWIFTSATLSVGGDFSHYQHEMGLDEAVTAFWESPFDYQNQALLYVPEKLPEPNSERYTRAVVDAALPVIESSEGRTFFLFTSLRAMREARELMETGMKRMGMSYPLLMQGEGSRTELLERFRKLGNAVLLGSASFWEGVDVKGEALSLVIIDRLPFAPPDDPVLAARIEKMNSEGRNAFMEYQVPQAVITLKQGSGRLIRDENDRGVLMICDPRLISKHYGKRIWRSLPPMKRTRDLGEVRDFYKSIADDVAAVR
ncbi:MAG TPA: ATP-dependent DNA helicase [Burkholderiales bacterium]|nr:ATP-dependent DNA helicase [Burkholderiales bacterium]